MLAHLDGPRAAWAHLAALPRGAVCAHQPYWVLRAHLHQVLGQVPEAQHARTVALGLTRDAAVRRHLSRMHPTPKDRS